MADRLRLDAGAGDAAARRSFAGWRGMEGEKAHAQALLELGERAERAGDAGGALGWYEAAARADPRSSAAHLRLCSLLRRTGRCAEALAAAGAFAAALPKDAAAHCEAGLCLLAIHRNEESISGFERALAIDPRLKDAWRGMGTALGRLGRTEEAFPCFDRAEGRGPRAFAPAPPQHRSPELATAVHGLMAGLLDAGRGITHIAAGGPFSFKAAVAVLGFLLRDYDMDGVVVAVARPPEIYRQTLARRVDTPHPPHYVEVAAATAGGPETVHPARPGAGGAGESTGAADDVTTLSAFEPDLIAAAVKAALQRVAGRYGGEEHFVLMDDLAAMEFYNGTGVVKKFSAGFFGELTSLGMFSFVVLPDTGAHLLGPALFASMETLRVDGRWLTEV